MLRTIEEWKTFARERGTTGEMVFDILADWEEEIQDKEIDLRAAEAEILELIEEGEGETK